MAKKFLKSVPPQPLLYRFPVTTAISLDMHVLHMHVSAEFSLCICLHVQLL